MKWKTKLESEQGIGKREESGGFEIAEEKRTQLPRPTSSNKLINLQFVLNNINE